MTYYTLKTFKLVYTYRAALAYALSMLVGSVKEIGDYLHWWNGVVSFTDLAADAAGATAAWALVAYLNSPPARPLRTAETTSDDLEAGRSS